MAILGGTSDKRYVSIATIDDPNMPVLLLGEAEAISLRWAGNDHVLARMGYWKKDGPRLSYRYERNLAITTEARVAARMLENDDFSQYLVRQPVFSTLAGPPASVFLLGLAPLEASGGMDTRIQRKGTKGWAAALMKADPATGKAVRIELGDSDTVSWALNAAGEPRVRLDIDELTHRFSVFSRGAGPRKWSLLWDGSDYDSRRQYLGYSSPEDAIYIADGDRILRKPLAGGPDVPVGEPLAGASPDLFWDYRRLTPMAMSTGGERRTLHWLDSELGAVHASLTKVFKDRDVWFAEWSEDRTRFVIWTTAPSSPPAWYLFDKSRKELSPLGDEYPELKDAALGQTSWITYKARDGLEIPAYLTLPPGLAAGVKPPLVVLPHGGPTMRDDYVFDYVAQFLATRGYAVLQPQFRGSWGFGDAFEKAGWGEWGGKMQTDLLDGIAAVADKADAGKVCIVGASFGGYAALAGATMHPDAYKCAASVAGISDLGLMLEQQWRTSGDDSAKVGELRTMLGAADKGKLNATSPALLVSKTTAPVLLVHGDQDTVVPPQQSQVMANALKAAGRPYEYVVLPGENHDMTRSATRTQMLQALESFLAKNLPATN
ncbi:MULTISPECIES: S9 family peptidase [unclassified Phenylobacterium]|uniref:alpha/beta hydrolase family protein n=1 Tax=unclassified Phenylobacterium TaxID=2640670 RepID=UPI000AFA2021|nr:MULTISPECIES: S9 family peptidase [unclassified Phenylobacterium]